MTLIARRARYCLPLFLCLWPLYSIFCALHYRLYDDALDNGLLLDEAFEGYLRHETSDLVPERLDSDTDDEGTQMRNAFVEAYPARQQEVQLTFTKDVQHRMASPFKSHEDLEFVRHLFRPIVSCPSLYRAGNDSAGHWLCGLPTFLKRKRRCHIYAFNWNITDVTFEEAILEKTSCLVHVFDPFLSDDDKEWLRHMHPRLKFYDFTVGLARDTRYLFDELDPELKSVEEKNLYQITQLLRHSWIDVLKIDYRGETSMKLAEIVVHWKQVMKMTNTTRPFPVGQVLFQMPTSDGDALQIARRIVSLMNMGLVVYHAEVYNGTEYPLENVAFSLVNLKNWRTFKEIDRV